MMPERQDTVSHNLSLIIRFHWAILVIGPFALYLSGRPACKATWVAYGLFFVFTAVFQWVLDRRPESLPWELLGHAVLTVDLLLVTLLVVFRGGLESDIYHFYYLVIVGYAIAFGLSESLISAAVAGLLYLAAALIGTEGPADFGRVATRTLYLAFTGTAAAYLAGREKRHRLGRTEAQRLLDELRQAHAELAVHARKMSERAVTDGLTQLYNHAYLHQRLDEELARAERYGKRMSLLMLDLDDFKAHNDTYGHVEGDRLLADVAAILSGAVRKGDAACRYGGEEFAVVMPEAGREAAVMAGERICRLVDKKTPESGELTRPITVSVGVATYPEDALTKMDLIAAADRALYRSKAAGKNRVS